MSNNTLDDATINKMIPAIFDQMRSNQQLNSKISFTSKNSTLSTQSLLKEQEQLDKIISVIENLNKSLKNCAPDNLNRIKKTCEMVNRVLDTWIEIQSQANYFAELMNNNLYLKYVNSIKNNEINNKEDNNQLDYLTMKIKEVEELKKKIQEKKERELESLNDNHLKTSSKSIRGSSKIPIRTNGRVTKQRSKKIFK